MTSHDSHRIAALLEESRDGGPDATERLLQLVYPELRRRAGLLMKGERVSHTLQPTAVVHEAFLRLFKHPHTYWEDSEHFFFVVSREMRHILTDYARRRLSCKRGGRNLRVGMEEVQIEDRAARIEQAVAVGEALEILQQLDERAARVVELRFFTGLTVEEIAAILKVSKRTVRETWSFARVWLKAHLRGSG
jgi:RNA polymerase sigma-70 factor (ECF subfamily)